AIVQAGAALHLKPLTPGNNFNWVKNLVLSGLGITHPFGLINQKGALEILGGNDTIGGPVNFGANGGHTSTTQLNGVAGLRAAAPCTPSCHGTTTGRLSSTSGTLAADVQTALNNLSTIGGVGGSVSVNQVGNVLAVTFGGTLLGVNQPQLVASPSPGTVVTVA